MLIATTRSSPYSLEDIGYTNGALTTLKALSEDIAEINPSVIPIGWIRKYAEENGPETKEIIRIMLEEYMKGEEK